MKKTILFLSAFALCADIALARGMAPVGLDSIAYGRHNEYMVLNMNLDLRDTDVPTSRAEVITPIIVSDQGDSLFLPAVGVYGRLRHIQYLRNGSHPLGGSDDCKIIKSADRPDVLPYHASVKYDDWMRNSDLVIRRRLYGCVDCLLDQKTTRIGQYFEQNPMIPEIVYFQATDTMRKTGTLERESFVDFVVDRTDINYNYRKNPVELPRIQATIDTVYQDPDVTITGIWLKGYASPESPYKHNTDLAIGRTNALKEYVRQLYNFPEEIMSTAYEPEDWDGLRKAVVNSNIDNKEAIIALIDSDLEPDAKEAKIKSEYPVQYRFMLENFYPALRHTTYRVSYEIQNFDDIDKIREVMRSNPGKLSLREFFLLGNASEPGSDEFNDIYETAVRLYPDSPVANINAANAALQRKDYKTAETYLSRAGNSPQAIYARGSLAFLLGDYDKAEQLMREALPVIPEAQSTIDEITYIRENRITPTTSLTLD